jgi:hypothetical protein
MRQKNRASLFGMFGNRKLEKGIRRKQQRTSRLSLEQLESRNLLATLTFQQGLNNYAGQEDTVLYSREPDVNSGTEGSISPDQQDANGVRQGLMKFNDIIGSQPGQIPLGSTINSATLIVDVVNPSFSSMQMSLYRMQQDWGESTATWNSFGLIGGVQASEGEASSLPPDSLLLEPRISVTAPATAGRFDVTKSLEYWVSGADNFGWLIESAATDGWDFRTKESAQAQRPQLIVDFTPPGGGAAEFQILNTSVSQAEGASGVTTAFIEVARVGNLGGAASVNYTVAAGTAGGSDFVAVGTPTAVNFAAGQAYATIEVTINGDTELEGNETILVTLSGNVVAGRDVATLTIADDDALINEVLANVTNTDDETNREYIELIGTAGASLDGYYFVVFEAEEEGGPNENGAPAGVAKFVFDLSPYSFGDNGLLVIAPTNWDYAGLADADTQIVNTAALDGEGGILEDSSQTYALIRSPDNAIVQGVDYDTIGEFENPSNTAIGGTLLNPGDPAPRYGDLVGDLDQLPAGAQIVDSVGVVEGGGGDRDRIAGVAGPDDDNARPGVHVHQPTGLLGSGGVTSDAVSRRVGQTLPNSIGVWFNGDIDNGDPSSGLIKYLENTFFVSVVAPDGAVLTPGSANELRNVFFSVADQDKEIAEADGSVTLRIERTGDVANEEIEVTYRTVDVGSATEGVDYTGVEETLSFLPGESFKDVTINLLSDSDAEGFERFRVDIVSVSDPSYQITNGLSSIGIGPGEPGVTNGQAVVTIADANVSTKTFQNGVDGYTGAKDAYIDGEFTFNKFGQDPVVRVDQVKGEGEDTPANVRPQQGLIRFDDVFGDGANQVPAGSTIFDASLRLNVTNTASGADIRFFRMLQDWEQVNTTWVDPQGNVGSSISNGVTPDGVEASSVPDFRVPDSLTGQAGFIDIPLNVDTIQAWANGSLDNFGWSIVNDLGSLWSFNSSEAFLIGTFKPELTILYTEPEAVTGTFSLSVDNYTVNEQDGGTATITINRIGGSNGAATVNWAVTPGTGTLADITSVATGSVNFADGELFKTFNVTVSDDIALETNETLNLAISGGGLEFDRDSAVLTIRDNDFLSSGASLRLNEIWINSPGNDPPHEFVELIGDAGIGLGSLYYVAVEGLVGDHTGTAEKVVSLGAYSNGSNGLSIITPDAADFAFRVPAEATQIDLLGSIGTENVASQNDSTTYFLLYSPFTDLTLTSFDYDWNDSGTLNLPLGVEIIDSVGVRVAGVDDQTYGSANNQIEFVLGEENPDIDAITRERGNTDVNRGDAWYGGDLAEAGDDYLLYDPAEAFFLPVTGAAMSPGEVNTGSDAESPLVSLTGVTPNANGTVTAIFSAAVSQLNNGNLSPASPHGAGITITDTDGVTITTVDSLPTVTGLGTDTLTLSFTGSGVVGGKLPAGDYQLNFVGNGLIANGRAVDVSNDGTQIDAFREFEFTAAPTLAGDYDGNGKVEQADYTFWKSNFGATAGIGLQADGNGNGSVDAADYTVWRDNLGAMLPGAGSAAVAVAGGEPEPVTVTQLVSEPMAVREPIAAAAPAIVDSAFAGFVLDNSAPASQVKAAGVDAAHRRFAAGGSAPFDRSLLLAARRHGQTAGSEPTEEACPIAHGGSEFGDLDVAFADFGGRQFGRRSLLRTM